MSIIDSDKLEAFVLAGGKGKRLKEHIRGIPKPLVNVKGKPLIEYSLDALAFANVKNISLVVSDMRVKNKYDANYIFTEGIETILFVVYQCSKSFNTPYVLFMDGDSVYSNNILVDFFNHVKFSCNPDMVVAMTKNSFSYTNWSFTLEKDRVKDVWPQKCNLPHYAILAKSSSVIDVFEKLKNNTDINNHKRENHFIHGLEKYYLGWGLLFKLFLDNNCLIKCDISDNFFANINTIQDIDKCLSNM